MGEIDWNESPEEHKRDRPSTQAQAPRPKQRSSLQPEHTRHRSATGPDSSSGSRRQSRESQRRRSDNNAASEITDTLREAISIFNQLLVNRNPDNEETLAEMQTAITTLKAQLEAEVPLLLSTLQPAEIENIFALNDEAEVAIQIYESGSAPSAPAVRTEPPKQRKPKQPEQRQSLPSPLKQPSPKAAEPKPPTQEIDLLSLDFSSEPSKPAAPPQAAAPTQQINFPSIDFMPPSEAQQEEEAVPRQPLMQSRGMPLGQRPPQAPVPAQSMPPQQMQTAPVPQQSMQFEFPSMNAGTKPPQADIFASIGSQDEPMATNNPFATGPSPTRHNPFGAGPSAPMASNPFSAPQTPSMQGSNKFMQPGMPGGNMISPTPNRDQYATAQPNSMPMAPMPTNPYATNAPMDPMMQQMMMQMMQNPEMMKQFMEMQSKMSNGGFQPPPQ